MKIEVLVVVDCPNESVAMSRISHALDAAGVIDVHVARRVIADEAEADAIGMHGSPTILIDGHDPFASMGTPTSMSCRLYRHADGFDGAPSVTELIRVVAGG